MNEEALDDLMQMPQVNATPFPSCCDLHGLVKPGEAMADTAPGINKVRQKWNMMIVHKGKVHPLIEEAVWF